MAFIDRIVGPDEKLIGILSIHWIYVAKGVFWFLGLALIGNVLSNLLASVPLNQASGALLVLANYIFITCCLIGAFVLFFYVIMYLTTELGLTSQRVVYKRGWLMVDVKQSDLEEIKAADIDNGIFGRILNYGYINFDARFVENVQFPAISDPYRYVKALNEAKSRLKTDSMRPILRNQEEPRANAGTAAAPTQQPQQYPGEPPYDMNDHRYDSMEDEPAEAFENTFEDNYQSPPDHQYNNKNQPPSNVPVNNQPEAQPSANFNDKPRAGHDVAEEDFRSSRPIVFKRNIAKKKRELSVRIKSAFTRKSKA